MTFTHLLALSRTLTGHKPRRRFYRFMASRSITFYIVTIALVLLVGAMTTGGLK